MKYALVCPNEPVENGYRIAEVQPTEAWNPAEPTYWLACEDEVVADQWYFDTSTNTITTMPASPIVIGLQSL